MSSLDELTIPTIVQRIADMRGMKLGVMVHYYQLKDE